jgi:trans-aconitate methyltransferase
LETLSPGIGPFDLIMASAVLEHVPNLKDTLWRLWGLMAPGGWFYARTPYAMPVAILARMLGIRFDMNYPAHLFDLGPEFWQSVVSRAPIPDLTLHKSRPSLVETDWYRAPLSYVVAFAVKVPHWVLGTHYRFVGGWEVIVHRGSKREGSDRF